MDIRLKSLTASVEESTPSHTPPYKMAVFPWLANSGSNFYAILDRIIKGLQRKKMFTLKSSFYEVHKQYGAKKIDNTIQEDKIWLNNKPSVDLIRKLGKELNVDVVLIGRLRWGGSRGTEGDIELFLIDVKTKALFTEKNFQPLELRHGAASEQVGPLSLKLAEKYIDHFASQKTK